MFKFVCKLLGLPFLPPEHIQETFQRLDEGAQEALAPVMDSVYRAWIRSPVFEIHHWSVFMTAIRTNNDVKVVQKNKDGRGYTRTCPFLSPRQRAVCGGK